jgi:hypothetical protein
MVSRVESKRNFEHPQHLLNAYRELSLGAQARADGGPAAELLLLLCKRAYVA